MFSVYYSAAEYVQNDINRYINLKYILITYLMQFIGIGL